MFLVDSMGIYHLIACPSDGTAENLDKNEISDAVTLVPLTYNVVALVAFEVLDLEAPQ